MIFYTNTLCSGSSWKWHGWHLRRRKKNSISRKSGRSGLWIKQAFVQAPSEDIQGGPKKLHKVYILQPYITESSGFQQNVLKEILYMT